MPEITIKYNGAKTLKALKVLSELLDFSISSSKSATTADNTGYLYINNVPIIPGDKSVDISDMEEIISRNKMDAKKLRKGWQRSR